MDESQEVRRRNTPAVGSLEFFLKRTCPPRTAYQVGTRVFRPSQRLSRRPGPWSRVSTRTRPRTVRRSPNVTWTQRSLKTVLVSIQVRTKGLWPSATQTRTDSAPNSASGLLCEIHDESILRFFYYCYFKLESELCVSWKLATLAKENWAANSLTLIWLVVITDIKSPIKRLDRLRQMNDFHNKILKMSSRIKTYRAWWGNVLFSRCPRVWRRRGRTLLWLGCRRSSVPPPSPPHTLLFLWPVTPPPPPSTISISWAVSMNRTGCTVTVDDTPGWLVWFGRRHLTIRGCSWHFFYFILFFLYSWILIWGFELTIAFHSEYLKS